MVKHSSLRHRSSGSKLHVHRTNCCTCCPSHRDNLYKTRIHQSSDACVQTGTNRNQRARLTSSRLTPCMGVAQIIQSTGTLAPDAPSKLGTSDTEFHSQIDSGHATVDQTSLKSELPVQSAAETSSTRNPRSTRRLNNTFHAARMMSNLIQADNGSPREMPTTSLTGAVDAHALSCCRPAPFSHEPLAKAINDKCDYSLRITADMAKANLAPRPVRIYADGAYDMFHSGHARQLMQAKCAFPNAYLIVGVSNDADVHRYKGRTVMNETERYEAVRHCRYVDEVVTDAPWSITDDFLQKHKIDFVAHDDIPYASQDCEDIYKPLKEAGMFIVTQRTEGISTTDVIGRIVRDYDVYLRRNIRRGLSRKDLNISYMKEKKLQLQDNFENMMKRGSSFIQNVDNKRREFVDHLEDISHDIVRSFMRIFGSDGRLRNWLSSRRLTDSNDSSMASVQSDSNSTSITSSDEEEEGHQMSKSNPRKERTARNTKSAAPRRKRAWSTSPTSEEVSTAGSRVQQHSGPSKLKRSASTNGDGYAASDSSYTDHAGSTRTRRSLNSYRSPMIKKRRAS